MFAIFGFAFFTVFLFYIFKYSIRKLLLGTILLALLFNNFFWFPEAIILFWILTFLNFSKTKEKEKNNFLYKKMILPAFLLIFIFSNIVTFNSIHPKKWAKEAGFTNLDIQGYHS